MVQVFLLIFVVVPSHSIICFPSCDLLCSHIIHHIIVDGVELRLSLPSTSIFHHSTFDLQGGRMSHLDEVFLSVDEISISFFVCLNVASDPSYFNSSRV